MKEKLDNTEQLIQKEFHKEADSIEKDVEANCADVVVTAKITEEIRSNVNKDINDYEKQRLYSLLPEEDRRALELGRKIQVKKTRKKRKVYLSLAAALVLAMAIGMTSMGGPERVVKLLKMSIEGREVDKITSGDDNYTSVKAKEEDAYQEIKDEFGTDAVKIMPCIKSMEFKEGVLDKEMQTAELYYKLNDEIISYYINTAYSHASFGVDVEDEIENTWIKTVNGCDIEIKEYGTKDYSIKRYSARFSFKGLEYFLNGTMKKDELEEILNNLYFF
ncbi:DUF4367 domain-containing protein [Clostridium sp. AF15-17LB]|nr:DUF4367 domain-containing protein [Clostridium sp. AF15-17LB]